MSRLKLRDGVLAQTALAHVVLLDIASGKYFELNPVGSAIIRCLLEGGDRTGAVDTVLTQFDVERGSAEVDSAAFIDDMLQKGLLVLLPDE